MRLYKSGFQYLAAFELGVFNLQPVMGKISTLKHFFEFLVFHGECQKFFKFRMTGG